MIIFYTLLTLLNKLLPEGRLLQLKLNQFNTHIHFLKYNRQNIYIN